MASTKSVLATVIGVFSSRFLIVFMLYVVANAAGRYLGSQLLGVTEISTRWLLVPMVLAGISLPQFAKEHLTWTSA